MRKRIFAALSRCALVSVCALAPSALPSVASRLRAAAAEPPKSEAAKPEPAMPPSAKADAAKSKSAKPDANAPAPATPDLSTPEGVEAALAKIEADRVEAVRVKKIYDERDRLWSEALIFGSQEKWEQAITAGRAIVAFQTKHWGAECPDNAIALLNIAGWQEAKYDFPASMATYHHLRPLCEKVLGPKHWHTVTVRLHAEMGDRYLKFGHDDRREAIKAAWCDYRSAYQHRLGNDTYALKDAEEAVEKRTRLFGRKSFATAMSLSNLGAAYAGLGRFEKARPAIEESLALNREFYGPDHPQSLNSLANLGAICCNTKDYARAEKLFQENAQKCLDIYGYDDPHTVEAVGTLGAFYLDKGDLSKAEGLLRVALRKDRELYGKDSLQLAPRLEALGLLCQKMGKIAEAEGHYQQLVDLHRRMLGDKHASTARALSKYGEFAQATNNYSQAERHFRLALEIQHSDLSEGDIDEANTLSRLGILYRDRHDLARAETYLRKALSIYRRRVTDYHPQTAKTRAALATVLVRLKHNEEAEKLLADALAMLEKTIGPDQADTHAVMFQLADVYQQQEKYDEAEKLFRQVLPKLPDDLAGKGAVLQHLAQIAFRREDYAHAREAASEILELFPMQINDQDPFWTEIFTIAGMSNRALGNTKESLRYLVRALESAESQVETSAMAQSERQQIALSTGLRHVLDRYLSLPDAQVSPAEAYSHIVLWKGAILARQVRERRDRKAGADPVAEHLFKVCEELTRRSLQVPEPSERDSWLRALDWLKDERDKCESQLAMRGRDKRAHTKNASVTPEVLRKSLPPGTALVDVLEYQHYSFTSEPAAAPQAGSPQKPVAAAERRLAAFVIRPDRPMERIEMGPAKPIERAIESWRRNVKRAAAQSDAGVKLRRLVWQPLESHLEGCRTILFSPDAALSRMPLHALPGREPGSFLIEDVAIVVVPVPQLLPEMLAAPVGNKSQSPPSLLLVGDVDYDAATGARSRGREAV